MFLESPAPLLVPKRQLESEASLSAAFLAGLCSALTSCICQTPELPVLYWDFRFCLSLCRVVEFCVGLGNPWARLCPYLLLGVSQLCFLSLLGTEVRSPWAEEGLSCEHITAGIPLQFHESASRDGTSIAERSYKIRITDFSYTS